jgi:translation initiation factor 2B subunit (eIF-2B alpha/beta/delta family)
VILTYGFSRVVLTVLLRALAQDKRFRVVVSESRPDGAGYLSPSSLSSLYLAFAHPMVTRWETRSRLASAES